MLAALDPMEGGDRQLPGARAEEKILDHYFDELLCLIRERAPYTNMVKRLSDVELFHFSGHGHFD